MASTAISNLVKLMKVGWQLVSSRPKDSRPNDVEPFTLRQSDEVSEVQLKPSASGKKLRHWLRKRVLLLKCDVTWEKTAEIWSFFSSSLALKDFLKFMAPFNGSAAFCRIQKLPNKDIFVLSWCVCYTLGFTTASWGPDIHLHLICVSIPTQTNST